MILCFQLVLLAVAAFLTFALAEGDGIASMEKRGLSDLMRDLDFKGDEKGKYGDRVTVTITKEKAVAAAGTGNVQISYLTTTVFGTAQATTIMPPCQNVTQLRTVTLTFSAGAAAATSISTDIVNSVVAQSAATSVSVLTVSGETVTLISTMTVSGQPSILISTATVFQTAISMSTVTAPVETSISMSTITVSGAASTITSTVMSTILTTAAAAGAVATGSGILQPDGSCACQVLCGAGSFSYIFGASNAPALSTSTLQTVASIPQQSSGFQSSAVSTTATVQPAVSVTQSPTSTAALSSVTGGSSLEISLTTSNTATITSATLASVLELSETVPVQATVTAEAASAPPGVINISTFSLNSVLTLGNLASATISV